MNIRPDDYLLMHCVRRSRSELLLLKQLCVKINIITITEMIQVIIRCQIP